MSSSRNRAAVKRRILDVLQQVLPADVTATYGWPGDEIDNNCIYLGQTEGTTTAESIGRGPRRLTRDDFTIAAAVNVFGRESNVEAEEACEAIVRLVDDTFESLSRLRSPALVDGDEIALFDGVRKCGLGNVDGPNSGGGAQDSYWGQAVLEFVCSTDLT